MASYMLLACMATVVGGSDCTIVQFTANWCQPCRQMQPTLQRLDQEGWDIRTVDTDQQPQLAAQFNIQNLPTLVFLNGDQEVDRIVGIASYEQVHKRARRVAARSGTGHSHSTSEPPHQLAREQSHRHPPQPIVRGQSPGIGILSQSATNMLSAVQSMATTSNDHLHTPSSSFELPSNGSPEPPVLSVDQAIQRAAAATVRIRVDEGSTTAYGSGTIIDVHGSDALVLTCGHLFREMRAGSELSVDLFAGTPQEVNLTAQLIDFKADDTDIGLISFSLPVRVEPVPLLSRGVSLKIGQPAFSFGCDHGANPTRRDTTITNINRYIGAANIEIEGAPAIGRSGGGLFDMRGRLIGVCNAADANDDEGIYAAADVIYAQIERLGLSELFEGSEPAAPTQLASNPQTAAEPASFAQPVPDSLAHSHQPDTQAPSGANQLICIVRDANGRDKLITINAPSNELLQRIKRDAQGQPADSR